MQLMHKHKPHNIMLTTLRLPPMLGCTKRIVIPMATVVVMVTSMIVRHTTTMQQEQHMSHKLKIIQILLVGINKKMIVQ